MRPWDHIDKARNLSSVLRFGLDPKDFFPVPNRPDEADGEYSTKFLNELLKVAEKVTQPSGDLYQNAFQEWEKFVGKRAITKRLKLRDRMHIGLGATSILATNVTLHPLHGLPYIPGSTVKGALRAHMENKVKVLERKNDSEAKDSRNLVTELFGSIRANEETGGALVVHDAWWVPGDGVAPLVREIETPHHGDYYTGNSQQATDFDDPNPIAQLAVQGTFLFAIEYQNIGKEWATFCIEELASSLKEWGIGGRTFSAGYGIFVEEGVVDY